MGDLKNDSSSLHKHDFIETSGTFDGFCDALTIWINKPHVVNRRLCGSRVKCQNIVGKRNLNYTLINKLLTDLTLRLSSGNSFLSDFRSKINQDLKCVDQNGVDSLHLSFATNTIDVGFLNINEDQDDDKIDKNNFEKSVYQSKPDNDTDIYKNHNIGNVNQSDIAHDGNTNSEIAPLLDTGQGNISVIVRELLPKQPERHRNMPELILFDADNQTCTFYPLVPLSTTVDYHEIVYEFKYCSDDKSNRIELGVSETDQTRDSERKLSLTWLQDVLIKKLARWSETPNLKTTLTSLKLLQVDEYSRLYSELKNKYGLHFAKIWPENTDPQKFVFEDVSIATYLLLLWKQDREKKGLTKKQSFVDLGCGNGLLVHILASEGHPGYGLDIRRRKIWDLYGPETVLKESTVTPSSECLFPDCDWLIGNHSDELTPWIPVMAARSAYTCRYFVLPCCHFDFNAKFSYDPEFENMSEGQYQCYLNFVRYVGEECGFEVEEDVLRIPSTKRVCFIGRTRSYDQSCEQTMDQSRQAFIERRCGLYRDCDTKNSNESVINNGATGDWVQNFTPRGKVETVRNCVKISQDVKDKVIGKVFREILESHDCEIKTGHDGNTWRKGGQIPISEVANLFDKLTLGELKNECGGLQTLLRNCSQVFQVSSGVVQLRDFTVDDPFEGRRKKGRQSSKGDYFKTSLCWFFSNHPDGCPRAAERCMYAHGEEELKEKPVRNKQK